MLAAAAAALLSACATPPWPAPQAAPQVAPPARSALEVAAGNQVVLSALGFLDVGYRAGGNTAADGFDCSGFTRHVYAQALGRVLPRRAEDQARQAGLLAIPADSLEPGDLVFFDTLQRSHSHVGIYVGDGRFIHAPRTGAAVRIEGLRAPYWASRFDGARRAPPQALAGAAAAP